MWSPTSSTLDIDGVPRAESSAHQEPLHDHARAVRRASAAPGTFLVSATSMGGVFGQDEAGATAPLGGGVLGFTKAYKRERPDALVKVVDVAAGAPRPVRSSTRCSPRRSSIRESSRSDIATGCAGRSRSRSGPRPTAGPGSGLGKDSVFVVTGAAGGITSAIVADLAAASGGTFYLLDLVDAPERDDAHVALLRRDRETLKRRSHRRGEGARREADARGHRQADPRRRAADAALRVGGGRVQRPAGRREYRSVNLLDSPAVTAVVEEIRQRARAHRRAPARGRDRDQPRAAGQGTARVRPRVRHQGRRLLQPAARRRRRADRRDRGVQFGGWTLRQQRPDRLQRRQRAAVLPVARHPAHAPRDARHRHRLDGVGRHRHGDARIDSRRSWRWRASRCWRRKSASRPSAAN